MALISAVRNAFLNLTFPQQCQSCTAKVDDDRFGVSCARCWENTRLFENAEGFCPKCGVPSLVEERSFACRTCTDHHYDAARSLGQYERAMCASILNLKRFPSIPRILLDRIPQALESDGFGDCDLVIPVPLSAKRRAERGFNQAEYIGRHITKILGTPFDALSLTRKFHTPMHRASMDKKARELSVKNAFIINRPKLVEGRSILLVDDIFTSGATVSNCAKELKKRGAGKINVFTLARAI